MVRFEDLQIPDSVNDILYHKLLHEISRVPYGDYNRHGKSMTINESVLALLMKLGKDAPASETSGITDRADLGFYI